MLPRVFLVLAALLVAGVPVGSAGAPECLSAPPQDQTVWYPLKDGYYVYANPSDSANTGFWEESNGQRGLQIHDCINSAHGVEYKADKFDGMTPPASQML